MKIKTKYFFVVSLLFLFTFAKAKDDQKPVWKGKVETENGIKVIKNPKEPLYGEIIFDLEEEVSIGNENNENYIFYHGLGVAVDNEIGRAHV